jgi:hypothetical protein
MHHKPGTYKSRLFMLDTTRPQERTSCLKADEVPGLHETSE